MHDYIHILDFFPSSPLDISPLYVLHMETREKLPSEKVLLVLPWDLRFSV